MAGSGARVNVDDYERSKIKYFQLTQSDSRFQGNKPYVAYFADLVEQSKQPNVLPQFDKYENTDEYEKWFFTINDEDIKMYPEFTGAKTAILTFDKELEMYSLDRNV